MRGRTASICSAILLLALYSAAVGAQTTDYPIQEIHIPAIPQTVDQLLEIRDSISDTPEGGAAFFVLAMYLQSQESDLALPALTIALDAGQLKSDARGYRNYSPANSYNDFLYRYLKQAPYIARSYFSGADPENQYAVSGTDMVIKLQRNRYSEISDDEIKVFVYSSGADTPRPITMKRNNRGIWKTVNASSLFVGVRAPVVVMDDDL